VTQRFDDAFVGGSLDCLSCGHRLDAELVQFLGARGCWM
jgi:hypothetical protein